MDASVAVLGAGSWGTTLAVSLAESGRRVTLWARRPEVAEAMQATGYNPDYVTDVQLPANLEVTSDLARAAGAASYWIIATPSHGVRDLAGSLRNWALADHIVVCVAKGIERKTGLTMTQVLAGELPPPVRVSHLAVLYGPSHAEELVAGKPTTVVAAAPSLPVARQVQSLFMSEKLRVYVNTDVMGVEIGGSVKNIMAIATGISDGIGYGDNAKAALITRGLTEIRRLGVALGAQPQTFTGLSGLGDLVVTCTSRYSRNRRVGEEIGRGRSLHAVTRSMHMVAEGVYSTVAVRSLARRLSVDMPITDAVYAILFEGKSPLDAVHDLMSRSAKDEYF
ncbi:MAG: NAD(P)-dependent glycerol-3-phosphate dehydrogenase [Bacteroidota bacterium]|nr:NAD(P)-dependent glycerol-3-phosphate dehydrogenase [Bacteroidota bacterium]MDE2957225.1 NAD(P)-dependent glycerol-3-phosphate dehydrogenase [Bacteroidota bacterium]